MRSLLDQHPDQDTLPPPERATAGDRADATAEAQALRIVDRGLHLGGLLLHAGSYLALALVAARFDFGPHLLAGAMFGDFAGYLLHAVRTWRDAPLAIGCELLLFAALFAYWWCHYPWPATPEFRALFYLAAFGTLTARVGWIAGGRRDDTIWD